MTLPQLRPAMYGGALLVGLHLLAEFGALQLLRFDTFTTAIYDQYRSSFNGPAATMLASVLVLCCLVLLLLEMRRPRPPPLRPGRRRCRTQPARAGRLGLSRRAGAGCPRRCSWAWPSACPMGSLVHWLLVGTSTAFPVGELVGTTVSTVGLGLVGAALTLALALPVAWLSRPPPQRVRHPGRAQHLLQQRPARHRRRAGPGDRVACGWCRRSTRPCVMLFAAYAIMFLPRAMVSLRAAHGAGAARARRRGARAWAPARVATFRRVTLPLIAPGAGCRAPRWCSSP